MNAWRVRGGLLPQREVVYAPRIHSSRADTCALNERPRFIREWDTSNHDPADAAASLAAFEKKLRILFVEGYIMFDSGAATPELGAAKTITQIVYEQLLDKVHIPYGDRTKYLYASTHRADIAPVLAEIKSVVEDVLARLSADFHDQEVYMAFEALSLSTWGALLASDDSLARQEVLMQKARRLWRALGLGDDWASEKFKTLVRGALQHRDCLQKSSVDTPDNRIVWATFCAATPDAQWALPVIQLYVSHPDGTGDVERGLGCHAKFRDAHGGAPDGAGSSTPELCLEIRMDGPQDVTDLFTRSDGGTLLFTEFSRELAKTWMSMFGRRFSCQQRARKDTGRTGTGWRLKGSMKAVSQRQRIATDALVAHAERDGDPGVAKHRATIIGTSHGGLMRQVANQDGRENRWDWMLALAATQGDVDITFNSIGALG